MQQSRFHRSPDNGAVGGMERNTGDRQSRQFGSHINMETSSEGNRNDMY